jgi:hypothetical protein
LTEFPAGRENNREFAKFPAISAISELNSRSNSSALHANSRLTGSGNSSHRIRDLSVGTGNPCQYGETQIEGAPTAGGTRSPKEPEEPEEPEEPAAHAVLKLAQ